MPDMDDGRLIYGDERSRSAPDAETLESIRRRAYALWEQDGRPEGRELSHWLQAEHEIRQSIGSANPAPKA